MLVQLAASFVKLVAPAAVGGIAVNTRYLQKAGVPAGQAAASVGASQLTGMGCHVLLILLFGYVTGSGGTGPSLPPSRIIIIALLAAAVLAIVVFSIGPLRRLITSRMRSLFAGVVPRLLDVLQSPKKIATGLGGTLMLTAAFVLCLDASIRAFGGSLEPHDGRRRLPHGQRPGLGRAHAGRAGGRRGRAVAGPDARRAAGRVRRRRRC